MRLAKLTLLAFVLLAACQNAPQGTPTTSEAMKKVLPNKPAAADEIEVPAGTIVRVRLDEALSTARNRPGDEFSASLDQPVLANGKEVLPKGTRFTGHVATAEASGRLKGRGVLGITLDSFEFKGKSYPIQSSLDTRTTESHKKRNLEIIGGSAGAGAVIGAITGKGKGAAIGAGAGAAAGTAAAAATGKKNVEVPAETLFTFTLKSAVKIQQ